MKLDIRAEEIQSTGYRLGTTARFAFPSDAQMFAMAQTELGGWIILRKGKKVLRIFGEKALVLKGGRA